MRAISKERKDLFSLEVFSKGESFNQTTAQMARIMVTSVVKKIKLYFIYQQTKSGKGLSKPQMLLDFTSSANFKN